jgi:hypothetical protein
MKGELTPIIELGDRVGHRGLSAAPAELGEVGDQEHRLGVHQPLRDGIAEKGARHDGPAGDER